MTTPWAAMLTQGARAGVAPEAFWRLSLKEWRMLTAAAAPTAPMGRSDMDRLVEEWPDE